MITSTPAQLAAELSFDDAARPAKVDASVTLPTRSASTPLAAHVGGDATWALRAFVAGARFLELDAAGAAIDVAGALHLLRAAGKLTAGFDETQVVVRLPPLRDDAHAALDAMATSTEELARRLPESARAAAPTARPLAIAALTLPEGIDADAETFARAILFEWGNDLVLDLPPSASTAGLSAALERLRGAGESGGCSLIVRMPRAAPAALLQALAAAAGEGLPLWLDGVAPGTVADSLGRGASVVTVPSDPYAIKAAWNALAAKLEASGARRTTDLVLFDGGAPDDPLRIAAEVVHGSSWFSAPTKNGLLALARLREARGAKVDSALLVEARQSPPPDCCLYKAEEPDLKDAAGGGLYDRWVRATIRRRLAG